MHTAHCSTSTTSSSSRRCIAGVAASTAACDCVCPRLAPTCHRLNLPPSSLVARQPRMGNVATVGTYNLAFYSRQLCARTPESAILRSLPEPRFVVTLEALQFAFCLPISKPSFFFPFSKRYRSVTHRLFLSRHSYRRFIRSLREIYPIYLSRDDPPAEGNSPLCESCRVPRIFGGR